MSKHSNSQDDKVDFTPYGFQEDAVAFHIDRGYSINAFTMGLGKTLVALLTVFRTNSKALVVVPAYLKHNWESEAKKFLGSYADNITAISYNQFTRDVDDLSRFDAVVFDEAHYLKNPKAQRTKAAHNYIRDTRPDYLLLLTGTPIKNGVSEIWSLLKLCSYGPTPNPEFDEVGNSWWGFCSTFCNRKYTFGSHFTWSGLRNKDRLKKIIKPWYLRKRASQVLDLPQQIRKRININSNKHSKNYLEAYEAYVGGGSAAHISVAKAVNALAKVKTTVEHASSILEQGEKIVIFSDHVQSAISIHHDLLARGLHGGLVTGSTPMAERSRTINEYTRHKNFNYIAATIGSLSVGANLQAGNYMIFNDYPWVPADLAQAEKRIHRIGQDRTCFYYYIFASEVDELIYDKIVSKLEIVNEVTNG